MRASLMVGTLLALSTAACSSENAPSSAPDAAAVGDAADDGVGAPNDASMAGDVVVSTDVLIDPYDDHTNYNDCTPYDFTMNDHRAPADPRVITFPYDPNAVQYSPRCIKISVGQTITWRGDFRYHPLEPAGGDAPSPILVDPTPAGTERAVVFPNAGFFGFECATHSAEMYGAIFVLP